MEIYKTFIFHAAHRMTNMPKGHEYSKIHCHSFTVDIYVKGSLDRENGWVMDFKEIEKAFKPIHASLDHGFLNDIKGLNNPTSENLARWIWKELKPSLPKLSKVVVGRSSIGGAVYKGH